MAAALADALGVEAELIEGDDGIFDVSVDGKLVYSRADTGGFPTDEDIVKLVRECVH